MVKFIHTGDWQLGITRHFLNDGAQERYDRARFEAILAMGRVAAENDCDFVVVCGDVFESNQVGPATIARALEALRGIGLPVYLLPGNHDPLNDGSVFLTAAFLRHKPDNVTVVEDMTPLPVTAGVEIVGAPWPAKRLAVNPLHTLLGELAPAGDCLRICLGHGEVDSLAGFSESPAVLSLDLMQKALDDGKIHFIALGDKHSPAQVDNRGLVWYAGTPEATAFREPDPGHVNLVEIGRDGVITRRIRVGRWSFHEMDEEVAGPEDVDGLLAALDRLDGKENRVVRLRLSGAVTLAEARRLEEGLERLGHLFASLEVGQDTLHTMIGPEDIRHEAFSGFALDTVSFLEERIAAGGADAGRARDALVLLLGLARAADASGAQT